MGKSRENIAANQDLLSRIFEVIRLGYDLERREKEIRRAIDKWLGSLGGEVKEELDEFGRKNPGHWDRMADQFAEPPYVYYMDADPARFIEKVRCPVLAICGENDVQVIAEKNLSVIRETLRAGGNTRSRVELLPGLNHFFQHSSTGLTSEYRRIEETFDPKTMDLIAGWIEGINSGK